MDERSRLDRENRRRAARPSENLRFERSWGGRARFVLVPLDGSAESKVALLAARLVADLAEATVHIVHALDEAIDERELASRLGLETDETRGAVLHGTPRDAEPAEVVARFAEAHHAMLIAMTTRGRTAYLGLAIRPVVERVIVRTSSPVLLVRPELADRLAATRRIRRVLVPMDGAPSSAAAILPALDIAERAGASVDILFVVSDKPSSPEPGAMKAPRYMDQAHHEWAAWSAEFVRRFGTAVGACECLPETHLHVRQGEPSDEILRFADERQSDLIVLVWRGKFDPEHARVLREVIRTAPSPVLLLRATEEPPR